MVAAFCALALLAGCSDGGGGERKPSASTPAPGDPRATDEQVIRDWSRALSEGDVARAADLFAVPSVVSNGTPPVRLTTEELVRAFNASLPCGAQLSGSSKRGGYTIAVFRLTERVGGDCGQGTGGEAATAFRIRDGRIVEWQRVEVPEDDREPAPPPSSPPV